MACALRMRTQLFRKLSQMSLKLFLKFHVDIVIRSRDTADIVLTEEKKKNKKKIKKLK